MSFAHHETTGENSSSSPVDINSSTVRNRLDDLPYELRGILVNCTVLPMRAIIAELPQFRVRSDDVLRGRKRLCAWAAEEGYLDLLKWAHERGYPLLQLRDGKDACEGGGSRRSSRGAAVAARGGMPL